MAPSCRPLAETVTGGRLAAAWGVAWALGWAPTWACTKPVPDSVRMAASATGCRAGWQLAVRRRADRWMGLWLKLVGVMAAMQIRGRAERHAVDGIKAINEKNMNEKCLWRLFIKR
ncbi:hypothetical protein D3C72_2081030 [compost metagenome]